MFLNRAGAAMRRLFAFPFLFLFFVAACQTAPPPRVYPDLTWTHLLPYNFNVGKVEIVSEYAAPLKYPHVEHSFPISPEAAALRWGRDRIHAAGSKGAVRYIVKTARVIEVPLEKKTGGLKGYFTTDQSERYDLFIDVRIEVKGAPGGSGFISARAERSRTVPEDVTLDDREEVWFEMTEAAMKDLNATLEKYIAQQLGMFLLQRGQET